MRLFASSGFRHSRAPAYLTAPAFSGRWMLAIASAHFGVLALLSSLEASAVPSTETTLTVQMIPPVPQQTSLPTREVTPTPPSPRPQPVEKKRKPVAKAAPPTPTSPTPTLVSEMPAATIGEPSTNQEAAPPPSAPAASTPAAPAVLTQPHFNADYLRNPAPAYPAQSRRLGEEGKVILRVFVTVEGQAGQVELRTSSGSTRLDHAAQEAVARWKFEPARRGSEAVSAWVLVPIVFSLRG